MGGMVSSGTSGFSSPLGTNTMSGWSLLNLNRSQPVDTSKLPAYMKVSPTLQGITQSGWSIPKMPTPSYTPTYRNVTETVKSLNPEYSALQKLINSQNSQLGNLSIYNTDPNSNLREAVFAGNEQNASAIGDYGSMANFLTMQANNEMNNAYTGYNDRSRELLGAMGTADPLTLARYKGIAYGGLDQGYKEASDSLMAQLGQRGLSNSGVGGQSLRDLAQNRMSAGASAGVNAFNQAVTASDATRGTQLTGEGNLYNANMQNILGSYGRTMGVQGQNLQNLLNQNQQRIANLTGYSQLGRGMSGMANNYLAQAGAGYGNIGGQAGQTALGLGSNAVNYNTGMNRAQADFYDNSSGAKGAGLGALGSIGSAYFGAL